MFDILSYYFRFLAVIGRSLVFYIAIDSKEKDIEINFMVWSFQNSSNMHESV